MSVESTGRRVQVRHRSAQPVSAVMALVLLIGVLAGSPYLSPKGPVWDSVMLLGVGLAAAPLSRFLGSEAGLRPAQAIAAAVAVAALVLLLSALSSDPYHVSPKWPLQASVVLLGVGLAAGPLSLLVRGEAAIGFAQPMAAAAAIAALVVLIGALVGSPYLVPKGPLELSAALIGMGLVAGPLAQRAAGPREKVLSERVDELSRTRSGALNVQASELRRIERDLHDGAQARLVALSVKLDRAEDRYRDDPETAALLREAREDATAAIRELRELARGIAPPVLTDFGSGGADPAGGLIGLRQRVEALDGALHATSPAGVGTQVEAVLPCGW